jgi:peroxiredoxin
MSESQLPELESRPQSRREWSGWLTSLVLPLGFLVVLVGGLLYSQTRGSEAPSSDYGTVRLPDAKNATEQAPQAVAGRAAPDFVLESTEGAVVRLSDLQGAAPVVLVFFATWCPDCRAQMPAISSFAAANGSNVRVLGIDLLETSERVESFGRDYGLSFPLLLDHGDVASTWRVGGRDEPLPATFIIDAKGVVRSVIAGPVSASQLEQALSLLDEGR